ncbi:MAG TPA: superoxide dismutase family protein [Cyclobacteriaceae bacterium]|nr:superoxide dismutase family protein [Cyclobacteriaceae bacterium]
MTAIKRTLSMMLILLLLAGTSCGPKRSKAKAMIQSASGSTLTGEAIFEETNGGVKMTLTVKGATPGTHAVHLHESGDCSAGDATSAGGHWNPTHEAHGNRAGGGDFHAGDIANLQVGDDGTGTLEVTAADWTIGGDDQKNVIGKAVIIHANEDDFVSQPAGNAGARVGCGVVEKS